MFNSDEILIKQGAEAKLYKSTFGNRDVLIKERFPKSYRHQVLDKFLTQQRLRSEARCIAKCRSLGIPTPSLYFIDTNQNKIYMEYISNSITAKDYIDKLDTILMPEDQVYKSIIMKLSTIIGQIIYKMHSANITHGDLTTSNIIIKLGKSYLVKSNDKMEIDSSDSLMSLSNTRSHNNIELHSSNSDNMSISKSTIDMSTAGAKVSSMNISNPSFSKESIAMLSDGHHSNGSIDMLSIDKLNDINIFLLEPEIFLIDFGLSSTESTAEDKAVDLYVLERALLSTHPRATFLFTEILKAYSTNRSDTVEVINKYNEVRLRGRKRTMIG